MIVPTVGRVVWFYKHVPGHGHKGPLAAHVAHVHNDSLLNLMVIDEYGHPRSETGVPLKHDDSADVPASDYATWMPYQKGQAAKTEALEAAAGQSAT